MWPFRNRPVSRPDPSPRPPEQLGEGFGGLREAVAELRLAVAELEGHRKAMQRDLDDLDDSLRRLRGRKAKVEAIDAEPPPAPRPLGTVTALKQAGRYPFK